MNANKKPMRQAATVAAATRPYCFVSYSTREPHLQLLLECARILLAPQYRIELTPSALASGASQRDQITKMIVNCAFGIVCLDGLRPNVAFEYGILHGLNKPVILLREASARVDISSFYRDSADLALGPVGLDVDAQFSDIKDVNYATWNRHSISETMKTLWGEFQKKKSEIKPFLPVAEPKW